MHRTVLLGLAGAVLLLLGAEAQSVEPEGVLVCAIEGGGHDCEKGRCNRTTVTAGNELRLDFAAKQLCALRDGACAQPQPILYATVEEETKTAIVVLSAQGNSAVYRIGADNRMLMTFLIGNGRVIIFEGKCRRP